MTIRKTRVEKLEARVNPGIDYIIASTAEELEEKYTVMVREQSRAASRTIGIITGVPRSDD